MKVFDFSTGRKGKFLCDIKRPDQMSGWVIAPNERGASVGKYEFQKKGATGYHLEFTQFDMETVAEIFRTPAICFCTGAHMEGGREVWDWHYCANKSWLKENDLIRQLRPDNANLTTQQLDYDPASRTFTIDITDVDPDIPLDIIRVYGQRTGKTLEFAYDSKDVAPESQGEVEILAWVFRNDEHDVFLKLIND